MEEELAKQWLAMPVNANGRSNSEVVRPYVNARDLVQRPQCRWIVDFGVDMSADEAAMYEAPFEYVKQVVKPERESSREARAREQWWLHQRARPEMRNAIAGLERLLVTPVVAKHRVFCELDASYLPSNLLIVFAREDDYFFGVLHSRAHEVWSLRMGTSLEDRPRYTPTTTFETFPLPWPPGEEPVGDQCVEAIGEAAKSLNELRERWLNPEGADEKTLKKRTLTNLYNDRPTWLANAHAALDRAVWDAYGWPDDEVPADVEEDVILGRLLALNGERAAG